MKNLLRLLTLLVFVSVPAMAQDYSPVEVGGGYTYRSFGLPGSRLNMNGWNASANFNFNHWLALAADVDGTYNDSGVDGKGWLESYLFGPRIYPTGHHKVSPFVHGLVGMSHISVTFPAGGGSPASTQSDTALGYEFGGGVDVTVSKHIAVRIAEFDYERTQLFSAFFDNQSNFKYKGGIIIRF